MSEQSLPDPRDFPHRLRADGPRATADLGRRCADLLAGGEVVLLYGPLGAGKTCFVQGLCAGLGVTEEVVSPTFTLVNTYGGRLRVHHLDFYRVEPGADLTDIGVPELLDEVWSGGAVLLVEWPEPLLPELTTLPRRIDLLALPGRGPDERTWHLRGLPEAPAGWIAAFAAGGRKDDAC